MLHDFFVKNISGIRENNFPVFPGSGEENFGERLFPDF
jgi:hypothetical protein